MRFELIFKSLTWWRLLGLKMTETCLLYYSLMKVLINTDNMKDLVTFLGLLYNINILGLPFDYTQQALFAD